MPPLLLLRRLLLQLIVLPVVTYISATQPAHYSAVESPLSARDVTTTQLTRQRHIALYVCVWRRPAALWCVLFTQCHTSGPYPRFHDVRWRQGCDSAFLPFLYFPSLPLQLLNPARSLGALHCNPSQQFLTAVPGGSWPIYAFRCI